MAKRCEGNGKTGRGDHESHLPLSVRLRWKSLQSDHPSMDRRIPHIEPPSLALERARSGGLEFLRCYGSKLKKTGRSLSNTILTYTTYGLLGPRFSPGSGYRDRLRPADSLHLRKGYLQLTDARITSQVGALLYNCIDNQPRPIALDV
jgi:hypothetical protein